MYSPKIAKELIPILYQVAKARRIPMTKLVEQLLRKALAVSKDEENQDADRARESKAVISELQKPVQRNHPMKIELETIRALFRRTLGFESFAAAFITRVCEGEYEWAVVITDGFASFKEDNTAQLRNTGSRILTLLFGGGEECEAFEPFGEIIQLDQVIDQP